MVGVMVVLALLVLVLDGGGAAERRLVAARSAAPSEIRRSRPALVEDPVRRPAVCAAAGAALGWGLAGPWGALAGVSAGLAAAWWIGRLEPPSRTRRREAVQRDLPLAVDLLGACAEVGLPPERALAVVGAALPGPLGEQLRHIAARLALGTDPVAEWHRVAADVELAALGRTMLRTLQSGAPLAGGLARLAEDRRRERRQQVQVKARKVGVQSAGPLGLCFLPAFMLVGVVPTVVGMFSTLVLE